MCHSFGVVQILNKTIKKFNELLLLLVALSYNTICINYYKNKLYILTNFKFNFIKNIIFIS